MTPTRALVTGGARGIGAEVVSLLRADGCDVAVLDVLPAPEAGLSIECDIADEISVAESVAMAYDFLSGLDLAVLNAGIGGMSPLVEMTSEEWDRVMAVNLRGTFLCLRECARLMQDGGAIVAVSSVSGSLTDQRMGHYSVSKAGVNALVRVAARELGPRGIRVNAVAPGTTDTPLFAATSRLPGYHERVASRSALGGLGSARAVAEAIVAIAKMDWVTGQVLAADGGVSLFSPIDPFERRV